MLVPYSGKISRVKFFEVDPPQNVSWIKFRGSTRLSLHFYVIIRFSRINFHCSSEIHDNKIYCPRKLPAIRYTYLCAGNSTNIDAKDSLQFTMLLGMKSVIQYIWRLLQLQALIQMARIQMILRASIILTAYVLLQHPKKNTSGDYWKGRIITEEM